MKSPKWVSRLESAWKNRRNARIVDRKLVHKPRKRDVVIAKPEQIRAGVFQSEIIQPPKSHFLSWPTWVGHVEGMLMIEAAHQLTKAARKMYLNDKRLGYYFTGIKELSFHKLLKIGEKAKVRVEFSKERTMGKNTFVLVKFSIINEQGEPIAKGTGHCVVYDLKEKKVW